MTIAQRTGEVWESIKFFFKNNVEVCNDTGKLPKAPTGVGHFKNMGGIPEEKLQHFIDFKDRHHSLLSQSANIRG